MRSSFSAPAEICASADASFAVSKENTLGDGSSVIMSIRSMLAIAIC